ncbi:MAG: hypothetical protein KF730_16950 [Sphingomonas sp.]|uniref:surface-adhesin E family protein n=1 Tax=Sphingomonas sp. TaxID=28214 RepID=UPI0025F19771|nr:surface-adhesin E family protein [Sphingomonas sp.]MBX3566251.1 hypothetical protein [Sphingomonas sp.]
MFIAATIALSMSTPLAPQTVAPNWRLSSRARGIEAYINLNTVSPTPDGNRITFWREIRYPEPLSFSDGRRYNRIRSLLTIDCKALTIQTLISHALMGEKLIVNVPRDDPAEPVAAGSTAMSDLHAVCHDIWP